MIWSVPETEWRDKIKTEAANAEVQPQYYTFVCIDGARARLSTMIAFVSMIYLSF